MRTRLARALTVICLAIAGLASTSPALAENMNPGFAVPAESQEDLRVPIGTEVSIPVPNPEAVPGSTAERRLQYLTEGKVEDLAQYIGIIYNFLISIVGLVAAVMMIIGGFQYLTSAGDSSKIGQAKSRMANALIGVVLALGAYTILNTINPALLKLSLPDLRGVTAVTFFWPWCEDIQGDPAVDPSKFKVTLVSGADTNGEPKCGSVGEYRLTKTASTTGPCVYRGGSAVKIHSAKLSNQGKLIEEEFAKNDPAALQRKENNEMSEGKDTEKKGEAVTGGSSDGKLAHTCMQRGGMDGTQVLSYAKQSSGFTMAVSVPCAAITSEVARVLGYGDLSSACKAWFDTTYAYVNPRNKEKMQNLPRSGTPGENLAVRVHSEYYDADVAPDDEIFWTYCAPAKERDTCVQSDIFCRYVDRNEDDGPGDCSDGENNCGCEGYDESPDVAFTTAPPPMIANIYQSRGLEVPVSITIDGDGPEDYSYHLGPICAWNPCRDYVGVKGKSNFKKGCKGPGISTFVWGVRAFTADCRNKS